MPLEPPLSDNNDDSLQKFVALTDKNVEILHQIIQDAEAHPEAKSHPFRAILSAYHKILPQNGLDASRDQVYLRFLFRVGSRKEKDVSLYEKFETLLEELGIHLEFDSVDDVTPDIARDDTSSGGEQDVKSVKAAATRGRSRRASVQSVYDAEDESTGLLKRRSRSRTNLREGLAFESNNLQLKKIANLVTPQRRRAFSDPPTGGSYPVQFRRRNEGAPIIPQGPENASKSSHDSPLSSSDGYSLPRRRSREAQAPPEGDRDQRRGKDAFKFVLHSQERLYLPTRTQLLRDAETFYSHRIRAVARQILGQWCDAALESKGQHDDYERLAIAHDSKTLLRQAFDFWRHRVRENQQAARLRKYFDRLEQRATAARDLYLLAKAFTHWHRCTEDEAVRTTLVRQQILSIKYFYAWKTFTIENEAKVKSLVLRRPFNAWKLRYSRLVTLEIKAELFYQRNLLKRTYWQWFWGFCEQRAPEWHLRKLRRGAFTQWVTRFQSNRQRNAQVTLHVERAAKKYFFAGWLDKTKVQLSNEETSDGFLQQKILSSMMTKWHHQAVYSSNARQVSNMVDWRVAGATFATFVNRYRCIKQAENLDRLRLLRNSWTLWNDHLRYQTFAKQVDDRCLLEALYKWTVAERFALMKRLMDEKLRSRYLQKLRSCLAERESQREQSLAHFRLVQRQRSCAIVLSDWRSRCEKYQRLEQAGADFYRQKTIRASFELLGQRIQQLNTFNTLAADARFYFATKACVRQWHSRMIESKRQKRRLGYNQMRKTIKMSLASRLLEHWRSRTTGMQTLHEEATSLDLDRRVRFSWELLSRWSSLYQLSIQQNSEAEETYEVHLLKSSLRKWGRRTQEYQELGVTAAAQSNLRTQGLALDCLKRLRLRIIELKGPTATAENLRKRYLKRQLHAVFRHWQDKAAIKSERPLRRRPLSATTRKNRRLLVGNEQLAQSLRSDAESTGLPEEQETPSAQPQSSQMPRNIFLSTPSRRAARAKALLPDSTTPTGTPSESRIPADLSVTPQTTARRLFGRSTNLRSSTSYLLDESEKPAAGLDE